MTEFVTPAKIKRVVIVGAGLTGLSTALNLLENRNEQQGKHLQITIIEARDRVGGRTHTEQIESELFELKASVDVGGQWVGPTQTRVLKLLDRFGMRLKEQMYPPKTSERLEVECIGYENPPLSAVAAEELKSFMATFEALIEQIDPTAPWEHPNASNFDRMSVNEYVFSQIGTKEARKEALLLILSLTGVEGEKVSFLFCLFFIKTGGGLEALGDGEQGAQKWYISGGSQQISKSLISHLMLMGVEFRKEDAVKQIVRNEQGSFQITTRSEKVFPADHVVVAMCPALALKKIEFYPPLPKGQVELFSSIVGGSAAKAIVVFKEAFWLKSQDVAGLAGHFADTGPIQNMFHTEIGGYPGLVCLCVGDPATQLYEASPQERKQIILGQIRRLYFPDSSEEATDNIEDLLGFVFFIDKIWAKEEFSSGCYCGMWKPNGTFSRLGAAYIQRSKIVGDDVAPTGEDTQNLYFASTETSDVFVGYMEGAIRAGEITAEIISDRL